MTTNEVAAETYAEALRHLVEMAKDDEWGGATVDRIRQLLLALLLDAGHKVELGRLLVNADARNTRAIMTVLAGWPRHGWRGISGLPYADDFISDMLAR